MTAVAIANGRPATITQEAHGEEKHHTLDVRVEVQPVSMFESNAGETLAVAATNNYVIAYQTGTPTSRYVIFDEAGKEVKNVKNFPLFAITGQMLEQAVARLNNFHGIQLTSGYNGASVEAIAKELGIQSSAAELLNALKATFPGTNAVAVHQIANVRNNRIYSPQAQISNDSSERRVIFRLGEEMYIYEFKTETGEVLAPQQWKFTKIKSAERISPKQLAEQPFLKELCGSDRGIPIGNTGRSVMLERGIVSIFDIKKSERIFSTPAAGYAVDPSDGNTVHIVSPDGKELRSIVLDKAEPGKTHVEVRDIQLPGEPKAVRLDPQGNFFIIRVTKTENKTEKSKIVLVEKDTLNVCAEIPNVGKSFDLDAIGNIYFIDADKKLRLAQVNFMSFPKGDLQLAREHRREELEKLVEKVAAIDPKAVTVAEQQPVSSKNEEELLQHLREEIAKRFGPELEKAGDLKGLTEVASRIDSVKAKPEFKDHKELFSALEERVAEKLRAIKVHSLVTAMDKFDEFVTAASDATHILLLESGLAALLRQRREVLIVDPVLRKSVDERLKSFEVAKREKVTTLQQELGVLLGKTFEEVVRLVSETGSSEELRAAAATVPVVEFHQLRMMLQDPELSKSWKTKYADYVSKRSEELSAKLKAEQEAELKRAAAQLDETRELLDEIKEALGSEVHDLSDLARWTKGNPLITGYRARVLGLPEDIREEEDSKLDKAVAQRRRELGQRIAANITITRPDGSRGGVAKFGESTFPVFQASAEEMKTRRVPAFNPRWVLNEYNRGLLGDVARLSRLQIDRQDGILILEGEAGSGKNMLCDMFSHFTNRQIYTFPANFQNVKEDLTYDYGFDPKQGTFRVDSKLLEALQRPGTVIVFDEINTLPPGLAKMLNSLFDYRRTLFLPDGRAIKADPSVILVGTMNPQHYIGVQRLSQEVISRARVMYVGYPPEKNGAKLAGWEAEILSKCVDALVDLTQEEFYALWDHLVNNDQTNGADKFITAERKTAIQDLRQVVKTANKLREAYRAFRMGVSQEMIEFVFSLRESEAIAYELNNGADVKTAIKSVVLPKIAEPMERERVKQVIENV